MREHLCWELLIEDKRIFSDECLEDFGERSEIFDNPASDEEITMAEKEIGIKFPDSYKYFQKHFGAGPLEGHSLYGVKDTEGEENSIKRNTFYKVTQQWPGIDDWIVISDDGSGNPIGLLPNGEVWLSDHDSGFEKIKLAKSFEDFLYKLLTDTLYEEDE